MRAPLAIPTRPRFAFFRSLRRIAAGILLGLLMAGTMYAIALDTIQLRQQLAARFGPQRVDLFNNWMKIATEARGSGDSAKLKRINDFINQKIVFEDDRSVWDESDYWATPLETIGQGRGDCEDFAILKYVSLRHAGIAVDKLRLIYVKARINTPDGPVQVAHMVLAYYASPNAEPVLLDNLEPRILPASKRTDLKPVFSFNSEGIFAGVSGRNKAAGEGVGRLSRWEDVLQRIINEGYE